MTRTMPFSSPLFRQPSFRRRITIESFCACFLVLENLILHVHLSSFPFMPADAIDRRRSRTWGGWLLAAVLCNAGCAPILVRDAVPPARSEPIRVGATMPSNRFGALFCAVLNHGADPGVWGYCNDYFWPSGSPPPLNSLGTLSGYRVLVVPGIFGRCVEDVASPFEDARVHLHNSHNVDVELVPVTALGGTEYNAQQIIQYIDRQFQSDLRPYIAFGYSKGASDVLEAIDSDQQTRSRIAAIVTVAGSVLGSRLPDDVPRGLVEALRATRAGPCDFGDSKGIDSLRRSERMAAMARFNPYNAPKMYSIPAVSTADGTSRVLRNAWRTLARFSLEQDSQMLHEDAIVPGGVYLGYAKADHWAVALPFEHVEMLHPHAPPAVVAAIKQFVDGNHYPRATLFETALRYVLAELPQ